MVRIYNQVQSIPLLEPICVTLGHFYLKKKYAFILRGIATLSLMGRDLFSKLGGW